ncbi:MAG: hypothetical protein KDE56_17220 [Anaerolineales bacterium]|nr:hypothetical protein [Anaerolineales bacterium]
MGRKRPFFFKTQPTTDDGVGDGKRPFSSSHRYGRTQINGRFSIRVRPYLCEKWEKKRPFFPKMPTDDGRPTTE